MVSPIYICKDKLFAKLLVVLFLLLIIVELSAWRLNQQMFIEFYSLPLGRLFCCSVFSAHSSFSSVFLRALLNAVCVLSFHWPFLSAFLQFLIYCCCPRCLCFYMCPSPSSLPVFLFMLHSKIVRGPPELSLTVVSKRKRNPASCRVGSITAWRKGTILFT